MYPNKSRKSVDETDRKSYCSKQEDFEKRLAKKKGLEIDQLPDGVAFSPPAVSVGEKPEEKKDDDTFVKKASYIGSFSVTGEDQNTRAQYVREKLEELRDLTEKSKPVLLIISLSGIKVCSNDGQSVHMAHALKRISYATCDPDHCQFSFLAREPKGNVNVQYCHVFITESPDEAEELNAILGNAFKMAYANRREKQPSFNDLIEQQIEAQKQEFAQSEADRQMELTRTLRQISTSKIDERREERARRRSSQNSQTSEDEVATNGNTERAATKKIWAKYAVGQKQHRQPLMGVRSSNTPPPLVRNNSDDVFGHPGLTTFSSLTSGMRSYGSPVMALKESIDNHFNSKDNHMTEVGEVKVDEATINGVKVNGVKPPDLTPERPLLENYTYPDMMKYNSSDSDMSKTSNMQNRPLPATPVDETDTNGHDLEADLQRYQNDSPFRFDRDYEYGGSACGTLQSRYDSLHRLQQQQRSVHDDQGHLKQAPWYQPGIPREIALEILNKEEVGSFIVRDSTTHLGCFALSVRVPKFDNPSGIAHYLIVRTKRGVRLKGLDKEWSSLNALVVHHSVMPEMLPCTLRLPRNSNNPSFHEKDNDQDETDPDYHRLTDFNSLKLT